MGRTFWTEAIRRKGTRMTVGSMKVMGVQITHSSIVMGVGLAES